MSKLGNFMKKHDGEFFESSCYLTDSFKSFVSSFKRALNGDLKESDFELVSFNRGHFYLSGFLKDTSSGKFIYFSVSDVRPTADLKRVLFRTAKDEKDYTGGQNWYCSLDRLIPAAKCLLEKAA